LAPKQGRGLLETYAREAASAEQVLIRPVEPPESEPSRKDVRVQMEEGPVGAVAPGVSVSTDGGIMGKFVLRHNNFDLTDTPERPGDLLTWNAFRGAGQRLGIALEPGTEYSRYSVHLADSYWRDRPTELDVLGRNSSRWRESHDEGRLKGSFGFEQRLQNRWRRSLGFRAENVSIEDLDDDAPREIIDVAGDNQLLGLKFGLGETNVDNLYRRSRGHAVGTFYEQVAGDHTFGRLQGSYTRYFTLHEDALGRKTVLAAKILGATIAGEAPAFEKFYAGGTGYYGLRGFEYRGVSPRGLQTGVSDPQRKDPVGSDWIFLANAEATVPLIGENVAALFFLDSGTVETGSYRLSIGTGLQFLTPRSLGSVPVRFQIAAPLLRDDQDRTEIFSFTFEGILR
jgi:outer membrane protein assembly factor BamA